jgi:hypothetical protein
VKKFIDFELCDWVEESAIRTARKQTTNLKDLRREQLLALLQACRQPKLSEQVADASKTEIERIAATLVSDIARLVTGRTIDAFRGADLTFQRNEMSDYIQECVNEELTNLPSRIASAVASKVDARFNLQELDSALPKLIYDLLRDDIRKSFREIPARLAGRMKINEVVKSVDKESIV